MRRLAQSLCAADTGNIQLQSYYSQLKIVRLVANNRSKAELPGNHRAAERIDADKVHSLINDYPVTRKGEPFMRGLRNRALLAVLFYAGLRRFEAAKLKWEDVDFENGILSVVGGKARLHNSVDYVPFLGSIALHLEAWHFHTADRVFVFPRIFKNDLLGPDLPITPGGLYFQFEKDFAPHDARRTLISDLLELGSYIADVRAVARHSTDSSTLRYAISNDTETMKLRLKLGY